MYRREFTVETVGDESFHETEEIRIEDTLAGPESAPPARTQWQKENEEPINDRGGGAEGGARTSA